MIPDFKKINKALCIKPRGIGDVVLSTVVLENLKAANHNIKIDYLTEAFAKPVLENIPLINNIVAYKKSDSLYSIIRKVRNEKYDMVLDLWSNPRTAQITFLSGAKYKVGYAYRGRKYAYNILSVSDRGDYHAAEHNLVLLKSIGVQIISSKTHYHVSEDEKAIASKFFNENIKPDSSVVGIIPSGAWASKRCDKDKWVEICNAVLQYYKVKFLILWGPGDKEDADYIQTRLSDHCLPAPETSIREMSALINECDMIISNDSGPMHISAAIGVPTIGLFGPTNPKAHRPYSQNSGYVIKEDLFCIICNKLICPYNHECMKELPVEKIISLIQNLGIKLKSNFRNR